MREALAAGRIAHPNVVDVYDVGQEDQGAYLVMELLRGETLRDRLRRGQLCAAEATQLLVPAMRGVAAAHRAGVIHRDLKPDNIFLCTGAAGEAREAKVLDFGVSAVLAPATAPTLTNTGAIIGTPAYMSPEQLECATNADARSDVYAFGVVLYEALTGVLPFAAKSFAGLAIAIMQQPVRSLAELRPDIPVELERVVLRALAKRPEDRYADMDQLITALEQPTAAASVPRRLHWLPLTAASLAVLGLAGALLSELSVPTTPTNETPKPALTSRAMLPPQPYPLQPPLDDEAPPIPAKLNATTARGLPRSCAEKAREARGGPAPSDAELGRFATSRRAADRYVFRVPSLRNVELTPPYFHDGSVATLEQAVSLMAYLQLGRSLSSDQVGLLVAFLKTLTALPSAAPR